MGDTDDARDALNARKEIFFKYLETIEKREILFEKIFNNFLETYKGEGYIHYLEDNTEIAINFKNSIIKEHFEWMSNRITNQNQTNWGNQYSQKAKRVIEKLTKRPYCHFYSELNDETINKLELYPREKKILKKRCEELLEIYRCY